jgi:aminobenzoyl-glutamate utilization protein B
MASRRKCRAPKVCSSASRRNGSKPVHAAKGYYDGADAFISYHPHFTRTEIWDTQCGAPIGARYRYIPA